MSVFKCKDAKAIKIAMVLSLITTMMLLKRALSFTPTISKMVSNQMMAKAGKLMRPPNMGALVKASGSTILKLLKVLIK